MVEKEGGSRGWGVGGGRGGGGRRMGRSGGGSIEIESNNYIHELIIN